MKIGELATRLGTTERTLRYYEEQGLLRPRRSAGGTRLYGSDDECRGRAALELTALGIPLAALRRLVSIRPTSTSGDAASRRVAGLLDELRQALDAHRTALEHAMEDITHARALVAQCFGCRQAPTRTQCHACPVAGELLNTEIMRLVWDLPDP